MTSLPARPRPASTAFSAQDILRLPVAPKKYGILRQKAWRFWILKWPRRFVVLAHSYIYIYDSETSRSPRSDISLEGYNRVIRAEVPGYSWCFRIMPEETYVNSQKIKTFSCVSEKERKEWMRAIKKELCIANKVTRVPQGDNFTSQSSAGVSAGGSAGGSGGGSGGDEEDDYAFLEEPAFNIDGSTSSSHAQNTQLNVNGKGGRAKQKHHTVSTGAYADASSSSIPNANKNYQDAESTKPVAKKRSLPPQPSDEDNNNQQNVPTSKPEPQTATSRPAVKTPVHKPPVPSPTAAHADSTPDDQDHLYVNIEKQKSAEEETNSKDNSDDDGSYVNVEAALKEEFYYNVNDENPSLEDLCFVDSSDRTAVNNALKEKKEVGTYAIRKSRSSSEKVLACLTASGQVKEYKISQWENGKVSLFEHTILENIEALLKYYTEHILDENCSDRLRYGFHSIQAKT